MEKTCHTVDGRTSIVVNDDNKYIYFLSPYAPIAKENAHDSFHGFQGKRKKIKRLVTLVRREKYVKFALTPSAIVLETFGAVLNYFVVVVFWQLLPR